HPYGKSLLQGFIAPVIFFQNGIATEYANGFFAVVLQWYFGPGAEADNALTLFFAQQKYATFPAHIIDEGFQIGVGVVAGKYLIHIAQVGYRYSINREKTAG